MKPDSPGSNGNEPFPTADPYLRWHWATEFRYLPADRALMPVLVRLKDDVSIDTVIQFLRSEHALHDVVISEGQVHGPYLTVYFSFRSSKIIFSDPRWLEMADQFVAGQPLHESLAVTDLGNWPEPKPIPAADAQLVVAPAADPKNAKVVVAVIDDGIAFANDRFWDQVGRTRICAFWDQDSKYWLSGQYVDAKIAATKFGGLVDEERIYSSEGLNDYSKDQHKRVGRRVAHGTHVLNLATALPVGAASGTRPVIAVQLPRQITSDPSGTGLAPYIERALAFIEQQMKRFANGKGEEPPLVINLSYGMTGGPQDGTHLIEQMIDKFIKRRNSSKCRTEVVIAAGNSRLERGHAIVPVAGPAATISWRLQPDDRTPSALEIWIPGGRKIQVRVKGPHEKNFGGWVTQDTDYPIPYSNQSSYKIDYKSQATTTGRRVVLIRMLPTATTEPLTGESVAAAGIWTIEIDSDGPGGFSVDVFVQRDDVPLGYKQFGRQSYLEEAAYSRYDRAGRPVEWDQSQTAASRTKRAGTLNAIATGARPFVVGGYQRDDEHSSRYSSLGAASTARCPNVAAVSDDSRAKHGVLAAGTRTGSTVAMDGTSVAAPQLTRWIADTFAAFGPIPTIVLRGLLNLAADPAWNVPLVVRRQAVGIGLLELPGTTELRTAGVVNR